MSEVTRDLTSDDPISVPVDKLESLYNSFHAEGIKGYVKDARTNVVEKQAFVDFVNKYYYPMRQKKHDLIYGSKHLPFEYIDPLIIDRPLKTLFKILAFEPGWLK